MAYPVCLGNRNFRNISAHFDHLRTAIEPAVLGAEMSCARHDAADAHLAGERGIEWDRTRRIAAGRQYPSKAT
jgi:hypothetical protein